MLEAARRLGRVFESGNSNAVGRVRQDRLAAYSLVRGLERALTISGWVMEGFGRNPNEMPNFRTSLARMRRDLASWRNDSLSVKYHLEIIKQYK